MCPEHIHKEMLYITDISNAYHPSLATPQPPWQQTNRLVCAWTIPVNMVQGHFNKV